MSVHTVLDLPANVCLMTVVEVMAKLYGLPETAFSFKYPGGTPGSVWIEVSTRRKYGSQGEPGVDSWTYWFEGPRGRRQLRRVSVPWSIDVCTKLAEFFGGTVDFSDDDDIDVDLRFPAKTDLENAPFESFEEGEETAESTARLEHAYAVLEKRIEAVQPLKRGKL